jgi:hypothetical protein
MKLNNENINYNMLIFIFIFISIYHFLIQSRIEKKFFDTYFQSDKINRPFYKCKNNNITKHNSKCIGMPSSHAETITILTCLLYFYKLIPLWVCIFLIICVSTHRIFFNYHTLLQVFIGILIGYGYSLLYKYFNLSIYAFLNVFMIGIILFIFIKLDQSSSNIFA